MFYTISTLAILSEVKILFFIGPSDEPKKKSGLSWIAFNCFLSEPNLQNFCKNEHIQISVDVRDSVCLIVASTPTEKLESLLERVSDAVLRIEPKKEILDKSIIAAKNNILEKNNHPVTYLIEMARKVIFRGHKWENPPYGNEENLNNILINDILCFQNILLQRARATFIHTNQGYLARRILNTELHKPNGIFVLPIPTNQNSLYSSNNMLFPLRSFPHLKKTHILIVGLTHKETGSPSINHQIANDILGGAHYDSLLVKSLRRNLSLVYTVNSFQFLSPVPHLWCIHTECFPKNATQVIKNIINILKNIEKYIDIKILHDAQKRYKLEQNFLNDTPLRELERAVDLYAIQGNLLCTEDEEKISDDPSELIEILNEYYAQGLEVFILNSSSLDHFNMNKMEI